MGDRRLAGGTSLPAQHSVDVLEQKKDATSKQLDDDEWTRSLTEAQEATTDVPEDSVMYDQQDVGPRKFGPSRWDGSCGNPSREGEIAALTTSMRQIGVGTPCNAEALAIFHQLFFDEWMTGSLRGTAGQNQSRREKLLWDDRLAGSA